MRRLAAPVLAVLVLAGCSGEQGERAQQLQTIPGL
jgi:outer membrane murein-binding lipoprotein Lpp